MLSSVRGLAYGGGVMKKSFISVFLFLLLAVVILYNRMSLVSKG